MTDSAGAIREDSLSDGLPINMGEFRLAMREADLEDIIDDLIEAFVQDAPGRFEAIEAAIGSGDPEQIRFAAHAYKSSAATMHAHQLAGLLRLTELAGREGDADRAVELLPQLQEAHHATLEQLNGVIS